MMYIDLHCHLDMLKDPATALDRAEKAGLCIVMCSGISPQSNREALALAARHPIVRVSAGLYPVDALQAELGEPYSCDIDSELAHIENHSRQISAIGEIGLDYKTGSDSHAQKRLFERQLALAHSLGKPVIIHSRKAEADVLDMLEKWPSLRVVLHCFSGKKKLIGRAVAQGYCFTVPTSVVRSQQYQDMAKAVPLKQLFCETDSPYMSPFGGTDNEPAFVIEAYRKVAEIKGLDTEELARIVYSNWQRVFA